MFSFWQPCHHHDEEPWFHWNVRKRFYKCSRIVRQVTSLCEVGPIQLRTLTASELQSRTSTSSLQILKQFHTTISLLYIAWLNQQRFRCIFLLDFWKSAYHDEQCSVGTGFTWDDSITHQHPHAGRATKIQVSRSCLDNLQPYFSPWL